MELKILGQEGTKIFFHRIAFLIGDDPAQHDVASIKCGSKVQHPCIKCMYDLNTGGAYDFDQNNFRKLNHELLNVIGFIEKMNTVSEAVLINHLVTVCKMASSKGKDNIAYFKKQLFLEFWKLCIDTISHLTSKPRIDISCKLCTRFSQKPLRIVV